MAADDARADSTLFQAFVLSIVAGYADTISYLDFDVFAGVMTGNTVLLGIALAGEEFQQALRIVVIILAFLGGVAFAASLRRVGVALPVLLAIEAVMIVAAGLIGIDAVAAPLLAFGMAIQSAAISRFVGTALSTVYLTGDLLKLAQGLASRLPLPGKQPRGHGPTEALVGVIWVGYLAGVMLGVAGHALTEWSLLLALLLLPFALIRLDRWRIGRSGG